MTRAAELGLPIASALAGLLLLAVAAATGSAAALGACALLAVLLLAIVADPPVGGGDPRRRAIGRYGVAALALALATAVAAVAVDGGADLDPRWRWIAAAGGAGALLLLLPLLALRRGVEAPVLRTERTALARGAAVCGALAGAMALAGEVLPAAALVAALGFAAVAALEGVALARPGGAGLRRPAAPDEADAVAAAVATGPPEVIGHRRVVVRATGGAEYLSVDVLVRRRPEPARAVAIRAQLEHAIKGALPELVVAVRLRVGELPPAGPDDPTRVAEPTATLLFDEEATQAGDGPPTERLEDPTAAQAASDAVLPSAPWRER